MLWQEACETGWVYGVGVVVRGSEAIGWAGAGLFTYNSWHFIFLSLNLYFNAELNHFDFKVIYLSYVFIKARVTG